MSFTIPSAAAWPEILERERVTSWMPDFGNESSPPALDGTRQYRSSNGGGLWRANFKAAQLRRQAHVLAWMGMEVTLRGGMTPVDVPYCGYRPSPGGVVTVVEAAHAAAARDISMAVNVTTAGPILPGHHFSVHSATLGWRLYRIEGVSAHSGGGSAATYDISFWPPLRFAIADGTDLEFDHPRCVMRLSESGSMDLDLELRKRGDPSAEFEEAF